MTKGPQIRDELDGLFRVDGTYDAVERDAATAVRLEIAQQLIDDRRERARTELDTDEARAAHEAEISDEIDQDPRVVNYRRALTGQLHGEWREEAIQTAIAGVEHDVRATRPQIIGEITADFLASNEGQRRIRAIKAQARSDAKNATIDRLLEDTQLGELRDAMADSAKIEAEKLRIKNNADQLALDFTNGGVNTDEISATTGLTIRLGAATTSGQGYYNAQGQYVLKDVTNLVVYRDLSLTSMGDGRFRVDSDSLQSSQNPYAKHEAFPEGMVIRLGILEATTAEGGEIKRVLRPRLKAGATLHYDIDDTTPEHFHSSHLTVGDIVINGVSAREIKNAEKKYL